ncbi:hypothetical protein MTO96_014387 [Rhipicephalus appendiculatus]
MGSVLEFCLDLVPLVMNESRLQSSGVGVFECFRSCERQLRAAPPVWDSIHCWPPVEAGKILTLPCREVFGRLNYTQDDVRWGAGLPALCVLAWSLVMESRMRSHCWRGYGNCVFVWIIIGPMMVALLVPKATALLFPRLGVPHLFFCTNPRDDTYFESAYVICIALLQSSQVQTAVRSAYMQAIIRRNPNRYSRGRGLSQSYSTYCEASSLAPDLHLHMVGHKVAPMRKTLGPARRYSEVEVETLASIVPPSHAHPTIKWERNCYF